MSSFITPIDLYEFQKEFAYLAPIVLKYNELLFYTTTSQPGKVVNTSKSYCRKQRAYIRGYMNKDMAEFIFQNIKHDDIVIRTELHNRTINSYACECGSVLFIDDKPATMTFDSVMDCEQSYNLGLPLRRPYDENKQFFRIPQDLEDIVEFDIVDLRWNNNSDLWNLMTSALENYHIINGRIRSIKK